MPDCPTFCLFKPSKHHVFLCRIGSKLVSSMLCIVQSDQSVARVKSKQRHAECSRSWRLKMFLQCTEKIKGGVPFLTIWVLIYFLKHSQQAQVAWGQNSSFHKCARPRHWQLEQKRIVGTQGIVTRFSLRCLSANPSCSRDNLGLLNKSA